MKDLKDNMELQDYVSTIFRTYGPPKAMGANTESSKRPHFFLHRKFLEEQDMAIIFNTKRCKYKCHFCALPDKSNSSWIPEEDITDQFKYVINEVRNAIGVFDRLTIANEGSVLDSNTFPWSTLLNIVHSSRALPRLNRIVIESRLEFVSEAKLNIIKETMKAPVLDILTGFETLNQHIRDSILGKRESLSVFQKGLDEIQKAGASLTTYILFKPDYSMTDEEAWVEAEKSIDYVVDSCRKRNIPVIIRLNPMYVAEGTKWANEAKSLQQYQPPKLSDIVNLAQKKRKEGIDVYLGLTSEGLSDDNNTYRSREDFSTSLLKKAIIMNG